MGLISRVSSRTYRQTLFPKLTMLTESPNSNKKTTKSKHSFKQLWLDSTNSKPHLPLLQQPLSQLPQLPPPPPKKNLKMKTMTWTFLIPMTKTHLHSLLKNLQNKRSHGGPHHDPHRSPTVQVPKLWQRLHSGDSVEEAFEGCLSGSG